MQTHMPSGAITQSETKILVQIINNQLSDAPWAEDRVAEEHINSSASYESKAAMDFHLCKYINKPKRAFMVV